MSWRRDREHYKWLKAHNRCVNCGVCKLPGVTTVLCDACRERKRAKRREKYEFVIYPQITFTCAKCGITVATETDRLDKRTRFCSALCERRYWRHPPKESMLRNFHSMEEYAGYERLTNEL